MIFGTLERMKQTGMMEHNTNINFIQCQAQLNTKYHDENYRHCIRRLLLLTWKTMNVNYEVNHLYSIPKIIVPVDINTLYTVNLATRLRQVLSSKSCWIQRTQLAIYNSLNRAKKYSTYPIWSAITQRYTPKQSHLCAAVSCTLNTLCTKTTRSINTLKPLYLNGKFGHAKSLALFLKILKIDKQYRIGWHVLKFYNQFRYGWHK